MSAPNFTVIHPIAFRKTVSRTKVVDQTDRPTSWSADIDIHGPTDLAAVILIEIYTEKAKAQPP